MGTHRNHCGDTTYFLDLRMSLVVAAGGFQPASPCVFVPFPSGCIQRFVCCAWGISEGGAVAYLTQGGRRPVLKKLLIRRIQVLTETSVTLKKSLFECGRPDGALQFLGPWKGFESLASGRHDTAVRSLSTRIHGGKWKERLNLRYLHVAKIQRL